MAQARIEDGNLIVTMSIKETALSARHEFTVPIDRITGVEVIADPMAQYGSPFSGEHTLKVVGGRIPGVLDVGTYRTDEGLAFLDIHRNQPALALTLTGGHYHRVVVGLADPEPLLTELRRQGIPAPA
ncbi:MAG: hypothetical protein FWD83_03365 [Promicromonosporaceae bacterium]|nr:hypothetical protein [Promicromonosporaceae bacterium]